MKIKIASLALLTAIALPALAQTATPATPATPAAQAASHPHRHEIRRELLVCTFGFILRGVLLDRRKPFDELQVLRFIGAALFAQVMGLGNQVGEDRRTGFLGARRASNDQKQW